MDVESSEASEARFASYVEALAAVLGHADRQQPMHDYCLGLLMPIERKSVEPMAAEMAPTQVAAKHQSGDHPNCFDATSSISQSRSRYSLSARQRKLGEPLPGATAPRTGCHRALRGSGCARRVAIQS
jgi:SRSO17 transposase